MAHPTPTARIAVDLSPRALLAAGVSGVLAADFDLATSGRWTLASRAEDLSAAGNRTLNEGSKAPIAIVTVRGPLDQRATAGVCGGVTDGYDAIEARFEAAVMAVARAGGGEVQLHVHSPGGVVDGGFSAMRRMRALADRMGVVVSSVADESAASMGYALLLVADKGRVNVPPRGRTASIGTGIVLKPDKEAEGAIIFRSGERKMRPNGIEPLNEEDRALLQDVVDVGAADFAAWVAERRGIPAADILALKGASLSGEAARAAGLIDGNLNAHEVIEMALNQAALDAIAGALGLSAGASVEQVTTKAAEAHAASVALAEAKAQAAEAASKLLAMTEAQAREKAAAEAQGKRAAFAAEVKAACDAGSITPPREAALLAHYDAHGEASARATFDLVKASAPIVPATKPGAMPTPSAATPAITPQIAARAKELGVTPEEYAASMAVKES